MAKIMEASKAKEMSYNQDILYEHLLSVVAEKIESCCLVGETRTNVELKHSQRDVVFMVETTLRNLGYECGAVYGNNSFMWIEW